MKRDTHIPSRIDATPMSALAGALQALDRLRRLPLWLRATLALAIAGAAFAARLALHHPLTWSGRDLLLLAVVLAALLFGWVAGLVAAVAVRALSIWWFAGADDPGGTYGWQDQRVAFFLAVAVVGAAAAGTALHLLAEQVKAPDDTVEGGKRPLR
jgi:hypothetical protein